MENLYYWGFHYCQLQTFKTTEFVSPSTQELGRSLQIIGLYIFQFSKHAEITFPILSEIMWARNIP